MMSGNQVIDANFDLFFDPAEFEPLLETEAVVETSRLAEPDLRGSVPLLMPPAFYSLSNGIEDNRRINDALIDAACRIDGFAAGVAEPKFGDLAAEELRRIEAAGAVGVVLSARAQGLFGDDRQMVAICKAAADCDLAILVRSAACSANESLSRLWNLASTCPQGRFLILGAFASWENIQTVRMRRGGPLNVSYEISGLSEAHDLASLIDDVGPARLLFGSGDPAASCTISRLVDHCHASDTERRAILYGNAAKLIGLQLESDRP